MVAEFIGRLERGRHLEKWTVYPETAGWDLLLVHKNGFQLGLEAKLTLNNKVVAQALKGQSSYWCKTDGPDYRGVLVPNIGKQQHLGEICQALGIGIITMGTEDHGICHFIDLPYDSEYCRWPNWGSMQRCPLPDYIPDVEAGRASPIQLTDWKVRAIKLSIILDRRGWITRDDFRAVKISPTRWTAHAYGFLIHTHPGQYERSSRTPDFRAQHPVNYAQIEADAAEWGKCLDPFKKEAPDWLVKPFDPAPQAEA